MNNNELYHYGVKGMKWGQVKALRENRSNYRATIKGYKKDRRASMRNIRRNYFNRIKKADEQYYNDTKPYQEKKKALDSGYELSKSTIKKGHEIRTTNNQRRTMDSIRTREFDEKFNVPDEVSAARTHESLRRLEYETLKSERMRDRQLEGAAAMHDISSGILKYKYSDMISKAEAKRNESYNKAKIRKTINKRKTKDKYKTNVKNAKAAYKQRKREIKRGNF